MKKIYGLILFIIIIAAILAGATIGIIKVMEMPFNIPKVSQSNLEVDYSYANDLISQWEDPRIYVPSTRHETIEEMLEDEEVVADVEVQTDTDFFDIFHEIDKESLNEYMQKNNITTGYETLFIDKVDFENTPTGIKTKDGHDVLAIDSFNKLMIIGRETVNGDKIKIAIAKNKGNLAMSLVDDMSYWDEIPDHAKRERAILGISANSYSWNEKGNYGINYGMIKRNGTLVRKHVDTNQLVGFTEEGDLVLGKNVNTDTIYSATEFELPLIIDGNPRTDGVGQELRLARTAVGQRKDGAIIFIQVAGGSAEHHKGATEKEVKDLMVDLGAINASELASGNKSVIYWNGRVINETFGYRPEGLRLPTALVIKPNTADTIEKKAETVEEIEESIKEIEDEIRNLEGEIEDVENELETDEGLADGDKPTDNRDQDKPTYELKEPEPKEGGEGN